MPIFNNALAGAAGSAGGAAAYEIERSLRFNSADSAYLSRTPSSAGNSSTWTYSCWVKRTTLGSYPRLFGTYTGSYVGWDIEFKNDDRLEIHYSPDGSSYPIRRITSAKYRDPGAWMHVVVVVDLTVTGDNSVRLWVNGLEVTEFDTKTNSSTITTTNINTATAHRIGYNYSYSDFYLADVHFLDGIVVSNPDGVFGEFDATTGVWNPIQYTGNFNATGSGTMYSGMLTSSSGFYDSSYTAEKAFDGNLNTNAWNSNNYDNYMEFTPTTPINFTNGVQVYCYAANGYSITNYYSVDLDGNGLGSESTFVGGGTNFNGMAWISVATGSGTLHKLRIRLTRSGSGSGVQIGAIAINGSGSSSNYLVDGTPTGVNGFHLDFSDNSSNAALGYDAAGSNNWTVNNLIAQGPAATQFKVYGNASNSGSSSTINVSSLSTLQSTNVSTYNIGGTSYNHLTADLGSVGTHAIQARTYLNIGSDILVFASNNGSSWSSISNQQDPYIFTGRYIQWVRTGQGYDNQVLTAVSAESETDSLLDSPTNYHDGTNIGGNYSTWNPLSNGLGGTLSNGNLDLSGSSGLNKRINSTIGVSSGKWYYEVVVTALTSSSAYSSFGIGQNNITNSYPGYDALSYAYHVENNYPIHNDTNGANIGGNFAAGDTLMVAFDLDNNKLYFGKNGTWLNSSNPVTGSNPVYTITPGTYHAIARPNPSGYGSGAEFATNFGARGFSYTPPTGFKSICTQNLDDPLIAKGSTAFDILTWEGQSGSGSRDFRGLSFTPDLAWVKTRSQAYTHVLWDSVRGPGVNKELQSDEPNQEGQANTAVSGYIDAFVDGGFDTTAGTTDNDYFNRQSTTYVGWNWAAGSSTASNSDGSITSDVRANPSAGFSIVKFTADGTAGDSVGHGLNAKPEFFIYKNLDYAQNWGAYHGSLGATYGFNFNTSAAKYDDAGYFNDTEPTNSVITFGNYPGYFGTHEHILYAFAPVAGYSAFGKYTGNGSSDGPFVYTGFKTRWLMIKSSSNSGEDWLILDTARDTYNDGDSSALYSSLSHTDNSTSAITTDILSNGFKCIGTNAATNASGYTYIYAAFAENPFKYARAR